MGSTISCPFVSMGCCRSLLEADDRAAAPQSFTKRSPAQTPSHAHNTPIQPSHKIRNAPLVPHSQAHDHETPLGSQASFSSTHSLHYALHPSGLASHPPNLNYDDGPCIAARELHAYASSLSQMIMSEQSALLELALLDKALSKAKTDEAAGRPLEPNQTSNYFTDKIYTHARHCREKGWKGDGSPRRQQARPEGRPQRRWMQRSSGRRVFFTYLPDILHELTISTVALLSPESALPAFRGIMAADIEMAAPLAAHFSHIARSHSVPDEPMVEEPLLFATTSDGSHS